MLSPRSADIDGHKRMSGIFGAVGERQTTADVVERLLAKSTRSIC